MDLYKNDARVIIVKHFGEATITVSCVHDGGGGDDDGGDYLSFHCHRGAGDDDDGDGVCGHRSHFPHRRPLNPCLLYRLATFQFVHQRHTLCFYVFSSPRCAGEVWLPWYASQCLNLLLNGANHLTNALLLCHV